MGSLKDIRPFGALYLDNNKLTKNDYNHYTNHLSSSAFSIPGRHNNTVSASSLPDNVAKPIGSLSKSGNSHDRSMASRHDGAREGRLLACGDEADQEPPAQ